MHEDNDETIDRVLLWTGWAALALAVVTAVGIVVAWGLSAEPGRGAAADSPTVIVVPPRHPPPAATAQGLTAARASAGATDLDSWQRFALNAWLAPLIDDSVPPRWDDVALDLFCDAETRVRVDGAPLVAGQPVPAAPFSVRWDMNHCEPFGRGLAMAGSVVLHVSHTPDGLTAVVVPDRLRVYGPHRQTSPSGPFTATLSVFRSRSDP